MLAHNTSMGFHHRLKKAVKNKDLSQKAFGDLLNVSGATVSEWLSGKGKPQGDKIPLICEILDVPPGFLFSTYDEEGSPAELTAWETFEELLHEHGPRAVIALLHGSAQVARDVPNDPPRRVGDYSLGEIVGMTPTKPSPTLPDRKKKRTDTPNSPAGQP